MLHWFEAFGNTPLEQPVFIPAERGLEVNDYFIYRHTESTYQVWQCMSYVDNNAAWVSLEIGTVRNIADGRDRAFVITASGQPNWVLAGTVNKLYPNVSLIYPDGQPKPNKLSNKGTRRAAKGTSGEYASMTIRNIETKFTEPDSVDR